MKERPLTKPVSEAIVIIPARYASKRFPGKLLQKDAGGKVLLQHTWEAAGRAASIERVIVATDDERIYRAVEGWGGEPVMTSADHASGSDRIAEVARGMECGLIVNVQGDEPMIRPEMIDQVVAMLREDDKCVMATLANEIEDGAELADPNAVKVVVDAKGHALYFSRSPVPYVRDAPSPTAAAPLRHLKHLGIYGYRRAFLIRFTALPAAPIEQAEKLEQLRALYHGYTIRVGVTPHRLIGVDNPQDFERFLAARRDLSKGKPE